MFFFSEEFKLNLNWEDLIVFLNRKQRIIFPVLLKDQNKIKI